MKKISYLFLSIALCCCSLSSMAQKKLTHRFATRAEAQMLITDIDNFTNKLNSLDIDLRLNKENGRKSELLRLAMNETMNWSEADKKKVSDAFKSLQTKISKQKLNIKYPMDIVFVKTSMKEEFNVAAYTRKNWIALGDSLLKVSNQEQMEYIIAHEFFHLISRANKEFKKKAYSIIGFNVVDREIFFPVDIIEKKISNPDIEAYDSYAEFTINGTLQKCSMIIYSNSSKTTGTLDEHLNVGLIPLNESLLPIQVDGKTTIYNIEQAEDFYNKIGKNTKYIINPEEIMAENFALLLTQKKNLPNPEIIEKLAATLK